MSSLPPWTVDKFKHLRELKVQLEEEAENKKQLIKERIEQHKANQLKAEKLREDAVQEKTLFVNNEIVRLRTLQSQNAENTKSQLELAIQYLHEVTRELDQAEETLLLTDKDLTTLTEELKLLRATSVPVPVVESVKAPEPVHSPRTEGDEQWLQVISTRPGTSASVTLAASREITAHNHVVTTMLANHLHAQITARNRVLNALFVDQGHSASNVTLTALVDALRDVDHVIVQQLGEHLAVLLHSQRQLEHVIDLLVETELSRDSFSPLFRALVGGHHRLHGIEYLQRVIQGVLTRVLEHVTSLELDPVLTTREVDVNENQRHIKSYVQQLLMEIYEHVTLVPESVRAIYGSVYTRGKNRNIPLDQLQARLSALFFDALILPAVTQPDRYQLTRRTLTAENSRALVLISTILQGVSRGTPFSEEWLTALNTVVPYNQQFLRKFIDAMLIGRNAEAINSTAPSVETEQVTDSLNHLHRLLTELPYRTKLNLEHNLRQHDTQYNNGVQGYLSVNPFRAVSNHVTALHAAPSLTASDLSVVAFTEELTTFNEREPCLTDALVEILVDKHRGSLNTASTASNNSSSTPRTPRALFSALVSGGKALLTGSANNSSFESVEPPELSDVTCRALATIFADANESLAAELFETALLKEFPTSLGDAAILDSQCCGVSGKLFYHISQFLGRAFLVKASQPFIEELKKTKMKLPLDGKDQGPDFYKKNLKRFMAACTQLIQFLTTSTALVPVAMWHMTKHAASKSLNLAVAFWLCDFVAPILEQPDRYDLLPGLTPADRVKMSKRLSQCAMMIRSIGLKQSMDKNPKGVNEFIAAQHQHMVNTMQVWTMGRRATVTAVNTDLKHVIDWINVEAAIKHLLSFMQQNMSSLKSLLDRNVKFKPVYTLQQLVHALLIAKPTTDK